MTVKKPDKQQTQLDKFKEAAREVGTDDSEEAFDRRLKQVAGQTKTEPRHRTGPVTHSRKIRGKR